MDLRPLTLEDCRQWAELLSTCFDRPPAEMVSLLRWLYQGYPVIAWGAWDGGTLAAQYACLLVDLHLPEKPNPTPAGMSLNMAVHPDYRGRGLVKQVSRPVYEEAAAQGAVAGVGFSNAEGVKVDRRSRSYGYQVVGKMLPVLAWLRTERQNERLNLTDRWPNAPWCEMPRDDHHIYFQTSPEAIEHRYARHPFRRYQYAVWYEQGCIAGVVVYRPARFGKVPTASLLAAYSVNMRGLLHRWTNTMRAEGFFLAHALTTPDSALRNALSSVVVCAPLPYSRSPYYLTVKPLHDPIPQSLFELSAWDSMGGDVL